MKNQEIIQKENDGTYVINLPNVLTVHRDLYPGLEAIIIRGIEATIAKISSIDFTNNTLTIVAVEKCTGEQLKLELVIPEDPFNTYYPWWITSSALILSEAMKQFKGLS